MTENKQFRRWQFTLNGENVIDRVGEVKSILKSVCRRWVFQVEKGTESGTVHLQGRASFKNAKRVTELSAILKAHWSIEHMEEESAAFYCMKEETKISGPWSDKDEALYIPIQIRGITEMRPWQKEVLKMNELVDYRGINVIVDKVGNIGKTILCTYMGVNRLGKKLPFCNDYKDIMRMGFDVGVYKTYLIDMPRAIAKERLQQMYSAIEELKGGYAFDDRNHFRDRYFDCPNIWVFTNRKPDMELLSADRWRLWEVEEGNLRRLPEEGSCGAAL